MSHYEPMAASYDSYIGNGGNNGGISNNYNNNYESQFQSSREFQDPSTLPFSKRLRTSSSSGGFASMAMFFPEELPASTLTAMNYDEFSLAGGNHSAARRKSTEMCEVDGDAREHDLAENAGSPGQLEKSRYVAQFRAL